MGINNPPEVPRVLEPKALPPFKSKFIVLEATYPSPIRNHSSSRTPDPANNHFQENSR
jgi:hypothetical protein